SGDCNDKYTFSFSDTTSTAKVQSWDFNGDTYLTDQNPITYTFPQTGEKRFMVTTTLRDTATNVLFERKVRVVVVDEKADFVADKENICKGVVVNFQTKGIDSSHIAKYTWDFGDSTARRIINNTT